MSRYQLTHDAEADIIKTLIDGIAKFGLTQAEEYHDEMQRRFTLIAENPSFGADYSFVRSGIRRYEHISHSIYYRETEGGVLILRVLHKRMDPARHL